MEIKELIEKLTERKDIGLFSHDEFLPKMSPTYGSTSLHPDIEEALKGIGVESLYSHQVEGIEALRGGGNLISMTPTSSGKTLTYNIPVIESIIADKTSTALYLFPLKGLEQDQLKGLRTFAAGIKSISSKERPLVEIYDGDTTGYKKRKIRDNPPNILLTTPDMLHLGIISYHPRWEDFLRNLKYIVIDEIHTYRGVFGSHILQILKRLKRITEKYGSKPRYIASSATIENPLYLAESLTGEKFSLVTESGAPQGKGRFLFLDPGTERSPYTLAVKVFTEAIKGDFKTIAFTKARKITELMYRWVSEHDEEMAKDISSYRAGFLSRERREIEERLFKGELKGVISTSALELGVDIGGLDVCILVGYPGTISSTWQRAGRVGRGGRDYLVVMITMPDALDQYFLHHPDDFFSRSSEGAVLSSTNPKILKEHILCAAAEERLVEGDTSYDTDLYRPILDELVREHKLRYWKGSSTWSASKRHPHRGVSIRSTGAQFRIIDEGGKDIGISSSGRVLKELHPGAIYLHRGVPYFIKGIHMGMREVRCIAKVAIDYYTKAITSEETEILEELKGGRLNDLKLDYGVLRITEEVLGYRKKSITTDEELGEYLLELPEYKFTTTGLWMSVDDGILGDIEDRGYSVGGGLHALEHAAIATLPLFALCDRMDLGGVSYPFNPELGSAAIFIYDGHEGGVGLTERGLERVGDWFEATRGLMAECGCEVSCPSCTQDQNCGNNNEPLDKRGAIMILDSWLKR